MSEGQNELPQELENQFILRLPPEHASTVRKMIRSGNIAMKDKLKIDLHSDGRHAVVQVEDVSLNAKLVDLPCVVASLKTLDKKSFYKTADISQMLVCTTDGDLQSSPEQSVSSTDAKDIEADDGKRRKKYNWKHGITPPLKNVRKRRFRKIKKKKYTESPDVEKEVKRLLCSDAEAVSARWEVIADGETGEIESQGTVPSFEFSSGMTGHKRGPFLSEYEVLRELFPDYSNSEEDLKRELQAKFTELGHYEAKEAKSLIVMELQKQICDMEKTLKQTRGRIKRQVSLINKVEHSALRTHLQFVLEQLKLQEKEKIEQLISLQKQLKYVLEK
uniref:TATA-box binding protein associated factor 7 like n=1 Tax=Loxodonta africana TaxID=9785 RepID=G3SZ57_LOXAF